MTRRAPGTSPLTFIIILIILAGLAGTAPRPSEAQAPDWRQAFSQGIESVNSWERRDAILAVDPQTNDGVGALLNLLAEENIARVDWYVRQTIIERLSQVYEPRARRLLDRGLEVRQDRVREGVILALGLRASAEDLPRIIEATEDRSPRVRRAAALALTHFRGDRSAVDAILAAWEEEDEAVSRLGVVCSLALKDMTGHDDGLDRAHWREWWNRVRERFPNIPDETEAAEPESQHTRVRGVPLTYSERGDGPIPLLVIPDEQYTTDLYKPWFRAIEDICRVYYMELPLVNEFDPSVLEPGVADIPYYPVDLLVEAFDELREQLHIERFALMSHGFNAEVAQRYLTLHPDRVSHVIMMGPVSGDAAWERILGTIETRGQGTHDPEMTHLARHMYIYDNGTHDYEPSSGDESDALDRKAFTLYFADTNDIAIHDIFTRCFKEDLPESISPDFDTSRQTAVRVPMLIQMGEASLWTVVQDGERIRSHYPLAALQVYRQSAMCPFIEETEAWSRDIHQFFERNPAGGTPPGRN